MYVEIFHRGLPTKILYLSVFLISPIRAPLLYINQWPHFLLSAFSTHPKIKTPQKLIFLSLKQIKM
jgi:hypothetical protein